MCDQGSVSQIGETWSATFGPAVLLVLFGELLHRHLESELLEERRAEPAREAADLLHRRLGLAHEILDARQVVLVGRLAAERVEPDEERGEPLRRVVVELARQAEPLFLARGDGVLEEPLLHGLLALELDDLLERHLRADARLEHLSVDRLGHVVVRAGAECFGETHAVVQRGDHHDGQVRQRVARADLA